MNETDNDLITITEEEAGHRIDQILANRYKGLQSRTYFQTLIQEKHVLLNGKPIKKQHKPEIGDEIEICFILSPELKLIPENIPLDILYEDDTVLVINKPAGMVVHPAVGNWSGTFVNALLYHCKGLETDKSDIRPGIVHRLDKDTSGVLIAAKTRAAQTHLMEQFANRKIYKEYLAICVGNPGEGVLTWPIARHPGDRKKMSVSPDGRQAITRYKTLSFDGVLSKVSLVIETGRTHQIRVHLNHHRTPVLGDPLYGSLQMNKKHLIERQMLHAYRLRFSHPTTGELIECTAKTPADWCEWKISVR